MRNLGIALFIFFAVSVFNSEARANDDSKYIGSWTYKCDAAPYPYYEGDLLVAEKDKKTTVKVTFKDGRSVSGENVKIKDYKLSFEIWVEGTVVTTVIEQKDKKIIGKVDSPEGPMTLTVEKKVAKK